MESELPREDFVWLAASLCQLSRIPFDPALLSQRFPAPHSRSQFLEALKSLGFRTGEATLDSAGLARLPLPCIAFLKGESARPAILVKADAGRLLYFAAGSQTPETATAADVASRFQPGALFVRHETAAALTGDGTEPAGGAKVAVWVPAAAGA